MTVSDTAFAIAAPHARDIGEVCAALRIDPRRGLDVAEAARRLESFGRNALAAAPPRPAWRRLLAQLQSPLVLLLLAAAGVSAGVWAVERDHGVPYEALAILAIVVANALLGFVQEGRAEAAAASLKRMAAASCSVIRDARPTVIPTDAVVPGDVLDLDAGMTVAADARVIESVSLQLGEAALTGESAPVAKQVQPVAPDAVVGDRASMVFAGTAIVYGRGRAVVTATGTNTQVGRIAALLEATPQESTPLQRQLDRVGRVLGAAVIAIAVVVAATILGTQRDFSTAALVGVLLYTVSLAVSAVPEGLAAITTVVLSLGTQRMARRRAIVRRLAAVETLGAANVICTDKTGTLTKNEMTVRTLVTASGRVDVSGSGYAPHGELSAAGSPLGAALRAECDAALAAAWLANNASLSGSGEDWDVQGDPTEAALKVAALKHGLSGVTLEARYPRLGEVPFSAERKLMSTAHGDAERGDAAVLFAKGAPDVLLERCVRERVGEGERELSAARRAALLDDVERLAASGLRTLGLAARRLASAEARAPQAALEQALVWLGLAGIIDPPRPEARAAVATARAAGIRVIMITGDHPAMASAIAAELGIAPRGATVVAGAALERMDEPALERAVAQADVFARVSPEHKLRIVRALRRDGAVVAMTGDGVNDAPALKAADIGVAMGVAGTDVAREAADMVLADDNFATIVAAIEEGRAIYANIRKFLRYLLATNLGEVLVMFFGVALAGVIGLVAGEGEVLVLPLLAPMVLWINLVTDGFPALAVGVDPPDSRLMQRPPRDPREGVITRRMWTGIAVSAAVMGAGTLLVLDAGLPGGLIEGSHDVRHARTLAFNVLVVFQLFAVFSARSDTASVSRDLFANPWLWGSVLLALALQAAVIYVPALQKGFGTVALGADDWAICFAVGATLLGVRESLKAFWRLQDARRTAAASGRAP